MAPHAYPVLLAMLWALPAATLRRQQLPLQHNGSLYYWPEPRGRHEDYGVSSFTAPRSLLDHKLAWTWSNGGPVGKYKARVHIGTVIDGEKSIYLGSNDGVRKFNSSGSLLWHAPLLTGRIPTLSDGKVYITDNNGTIIALNMETGRQLWASKFTDYLNYDISGLAVREGVVLSNSFGVPNGGEGRVAGLDAKDGHMLWETKVDSQMWNFMPVTTGNGTFIFQDQIGGVYHLRIRDGKRLWKAGYSGPWAEELTDGMPMVKDGVVYAVHSDGPCCQANQKANLRAYQLDTGKELWKQDFPHPANSQPVVGYLGHGRELSNRLTVVMPIGAQPLGKFDRYSSAVRVFDAKTGELVWEWKPPIWANAFAAGDPQRLASTGDLRNLCIPNPYGSPSIDARGTLYMGHFNGMIYAIRDDNADGKIQDWEVSGYNTGTAFSHGGVALAPGMLAIASCDTLFVFKE